MTWSFAIVSNGAGYGPAEALVDYVAGRGHRVLAVSHPLTREQGRHHRIEEYADGGLRHERSVRVPLRPPLSFAVDSFVPMRMPRVDVWFGFNPLACARGLVARRLGGAKQVVLWSVDFVPERFGRSPLTRLYDALDRTCCTRADGRVELSEEALGARARRHRLPADAPPAVVVPMGAWLERTPVVPLDAIARRRVVFLGHLVPRQGTRLLVDAIAALAERGVDVDADIVGGGPLRADLEAQSRALGLARSVRFHGFVDDRRVEELLAGASVAVAPYQPDPASFTRFADPGKLKAYLAAGLPTILTDVPPNAGDLAREAGAEVIPFEAGALADAVDRLLSSPDEWGRRREQALSYARRFDWGTLLEDGLASLGIDA